MEIVKTRKDLLFIAGTGFVLAGLFIFLLFTPAIHFIFYGHWAFLILAIILGLFPSAKKSLSGPRKYSPAKWLALIFLMQLSLFAFHGGISDHPASQELIGYGLFPWAWVAILACGFAGVAYGRQENAFGNGLLFPFIKSTADRPFGIIINTTLKFYQSIALIVSFALIALLIAQLFGFELIYPYAEVIPLFSLLFLVLFSFTRFYNRLITRMSTFPASLIVCLFTIGLGIWLALMHALSKSFHFSLPLPDIFNAIQAYPQDIFSTILSLSWWLGLSTLMSLFLANISRGYSKRALLGATLILPLFIAVFSYFLPAITLPESAHNLLAILGFIISMILLMHPKMLSPLVLNYLPKNGENKFRNPEFLLRKLIQMTLIFLYIYLPLGGIFSAGFTFIGTLPFLIFALLLGIRLFRSA